MHTVLCEWNLERYQVVLESFFVPRRERERVCLGGAHLVSMDSALIGGDRVVDINDPV